ncbi:DUF1102 domain-containing protein [Geoglobus acetivorans]|uniref:DUF1102 domain-containing protein n=1 Tax=Geoglobus acetivorans TaxID=565033 RepID=A0ABZ3H6Y6_GEOAI|nr:DUF1102 domain-containing protein [Geoglobus acetivorans]
MFERLVGVVLLIGALVFALGIGADFASYDADRSVHVAVVADDQELIDLDPGQPYAYIGDDGKLYIDISENNDNYPDGGGLGISPDAKYSFDCMFNVSNHLWEENVTINVTITSNNDLVKLYTNDPDEASTSINFNVPQGEEVCVGMSFDGDGKSPGDSIEGQLTIHAEPAE